MISRIILIHLCIIIAGKVLLAQVNANYQYQGVTYCASCHNEEKTGVQYSIWKNSRHSESYITLASKKAGKYAKKTGLDESPQESISCLRCHVTGAGLDSSFFAPTYRKEEGVTCEACHKEKNQTNTILPRNSDCLNCHNNSVHKTGKFVYKRKYQLIKHNFPKEKTEEE